MDQQTRERHERRIRMVLPVAQLLFVKTLIVLRTRMSQRIVIRMIRLDQNSSRPIATSRPSRHLRDQLKRSFRRSKIRQRETRINRYHANQSHIGKVVSLRQHLRTDKRIDAARTEVCKRLFKHLPARGRVTINSRDAESREEQSEHLFELLSAFANVVNVFFSARRA